MLILVGPSASGKTEIAKILMQSKKLSKIITYTTRLPREKERNGIDYHFVSVAKFEALKKEDYFVEYTFYNGNYYGTSKKDIANDKLVVLDPNGLKAFKALNDKSIVAIYLNSSRKIRYERMLARGDSKENALARLEHDEKAFNINNLNDIDFTLDNENISLEEASKKVYELYTSRLV